MNRRTALLSLAGAVAARAAEPYRTYARCLPDYLAGLARETYEARNASLTRLTTPAAVRERQAWVRDTFWKTVGGMPERTELNTRTVGSYDRPGYRVEKLVYESRPGLHVPADLYIPANAKAPLPGVLFQMGHTLNGKAGNTYQKCCQGLVKLGYLVLAFDPMGQGERTYYPRPGGTLTRLSSADEEHSRPGKQMLLVGDTATRMQVWDAVRSLDVLASHPLVDPKRLASTGQSGGGTLTMLLAAVDDRLACAAVSSGNTENLSCRDFLPPGSTDDAEQDLIPNGALRLDRWDLLYPIAPKPLLILVSARDFFGTYSPNYLTSGEEEFAKLKRVYGVLGIPEALVWRETWLPHALTYRMRTEVYNFFERHLKGSLSKVDEPQVGVEPDEQTWVGQTGNTVRDFGSKTPLALAAARYARLSPRTVPASELARLISADTTAPRAVAIGVDRAESGTVETLEIPSAPGVFLPGWVFVPRENAPRNSVLLVFEPGGRASHWREGDLYHELAANGHVVCAFDVRGIGDMSPEFGRGNPFYQRSHSEEEDYAWASMMLGRPLLGQRTTDMLAVADAMRNHPACRGRKVVLAAAGKMTVPALCAAALDSRIETTYLSGGLISWANILTMEDYTHPFANFAPRILEHTDLPLIARSIAPRRLVLAGVVDAAGKPVGIEAVRTAYPQAEALPEPSWRADSFTRL